jgi:NADPH-dependent curcumin reductase CurA
MDAVNRQWLLRSRPIGMVKESDFELREAEIPSPADGEFLVKTSYLAFEPAMRGWMTDQESYIPPVALGEVMRGATVGEVIESNHPDFESGELVSTFDVGWQEYGVIGPGGMAPPIKVPEGVPPTIMLGVLGLTGLTAYFGLLDIGQPVSGDTVLVSGAAGATGSVAAQIAKLKGCRVVGIAGGPEKCAWLTDVAGLAGALDYKLGSVDTQIAESCPDGVNVFFDNVGGAILEAALNHLALNARIVICGGISAYNEATPPPGPSNLLNLAIQRGRMQGFIVTDFLPRFEDAATELAGWVMAGDIVYEEDIQTGFENAPKTFLRLFQGLNLGKQLLNISD